MNGSARLLAALSVLAAATPALAGTPALVTFGATLDQNGVPASDTFSVVVQLFDAPVAGNVLFSQVESSVVVVDGQLVIDLGSQANDPLDDTVFSGGAVFAQVTVNGDQLSPRIALSSAAFARRAALAEDAPTLNGLTPDGVAALTRAGSGLQKNGGAFSLAPGGVVEGDIVDGAVTTAVLADGSIGTAQLASGSVTNAKLAPAAVGTTQLADGSVRSSAVSDGTVDDSKLQAHTLTSATFAASGITATELASGSVDASKVADGSIATSHFASGSLVSIFAVSALAAAHCTNDPAGALTVFSGCSGCAASIPSGCTTRSGFPVCLSGTVPFACANTSLGRLVK